MTTHKNPLIRTRARSLLNYMSLDEAFDVVYHEIDNGLTDTPDGRSVRGMIEALGMSIEDDNLALYAALQEALRANV